ncbi:hypothetical protein [Glaciecola petra]|uniref:Uncharacterized protein n=1 Tax=Glaciecola petra TaxID=3075602 RepID=A0ABU2ZSN9_9ALTE|nr:hypothetical protein [Aestuariibacter sp. P117]MDT0595430.1 hypothetical protein [Aestuariibacter sp. P117]
MTSHSAINRFYLQMGGLLLALVIVGFGTSMISQNRNLADFPVLFHIHALVYISWFSLFIFQAFLIGRPNHHLHKKLGYLSLLLVVSMLVTAFMMASHTFSNGVSPVPIMTLPQFLSLPILDGLGLFIFFTVAFLNRHNALAHKHSMLVACIVIMDPAIARLAMAIGIPPAALIIHLALIGLLITHDWRARSKVHLITWLGLAWLIFRVVFVFTMASSQMWADWMNKLFN